MHAPGLPPVWMLLPFVALVLAIAILPLVLHKLWERPWFQALVSAVCMSPVLFGLLQSGHDSAVFHAVSGYATFIVTLLALYVAAGGVYVTADFPATPRTNVLFVLLGSVLASVIGTTGASLLLLRPFLRTNSQRAHRAHLVPFFILAVANAGGLLTPVGDPPLLMGFVSGVPFFWTLQLWPIWLLYVGTFALGLYLVDRRAYARESAESLRRDDVEQAPLLVKGKFNLVALCAVIPAAFMPAGFRELALVAIAVLSFVLTPKAIHRDNDFNFGPILEVGLVFLGLFVCLIPLETTLMQRAAELPIQQAWQMFLASGVLSAVLDNAPTYAAFAALARGLGQGQPDLVAGIAPLTLAALSAGSVVMGALTYIGNGPNLMVKSLAQRSGYTMPSFGRYSALAFVAMLPANVILTLALAMFAR